MSAFAALLLILAFPDFDYSYLAFFALTGLMLAAVRENANLPAAAICGWLFGLIFFFGTCWWLAYAPIHYAGFPPWLAYGLVIFASAVAAFFPAGFALVFAFLFRRFNLAAFWFAPAVWTTSEIARYWVTGNNWNAIAYSQAFNAWFLPLASVGGVYLAGGVIVGVNALLAALVSAYLLGRAVFRRTLAIVAGLLATGAFFLIYAASRPVATADTSATPAMAVVAIQPNVPMSGLTTEKWQQLLDQHVFLAESGLRQLGDNRAEIDRVVIFPESPMNFSYETDRATQEFANAFARGLGVWLLLNSAEPDGETGRYFNSAVVISPDGAEAAQYDKIFLLPFGEAVPAPLEGIVPAFVGNFAYGRRMEPVSIGELRAGVMICFESHFGDLSRHYAANGANVLIELTNDGYLGPTPVLRQHLANAAYRAAETGLPLLRVTNVGITAFISPDGRVIDPSPVYTEDVKLWNVSGRESAPTLYVRYGDWFAWLSVLVVAVALAFGLIRRPPSAA